MIGKNGSGKSTFIKTVLGEDSLYTGNITLGSNVKIGYLQQEVYFNNEESTVLETFRESYPCTEGEARGILARFLFYSQDVFKKVNSLSGGERSRLRLCQLMYSDINTLILDEPTNHLDILGREMLEEALLQFGGTIIFISHDRYFINKLTSKIMELSNKKLNSYLGNYDYYKEKKLSENQSQKPKLQNTIIDKNSSNRPKKNVEKALNSKKLNKIEEKISQYEGLISNKEEEINLYSTDFNKLNDLYNEKSELEDCLNKLLDEWITLKED